MKTIQVTGNISPIPSMNVKIEAEIRGADLNIYVHDQKKTEVTLVKIRKTKRDEIEIEVPPYKETFCVKVV